jgi:translation initiation factor 1A
MPNLQGGKKYKSTKHSSQDKPDFHEIDESQGQMLGRIVRNLGNRRMLVFCNDKEQRICRIRGALKKGSWISVGDIVLLGIRDFGSSLSEEKGDILAKYDSSLIPKLKKEYSVVPELFLDEAKVEEAGGFDFEESDGEKVEGNGAGKPASRNAKGDINIDDI